MIHMDSENIASFQSFKVMLSLLFKEKFSVSKLLQLIQIICYIKTMNDRSFMSVFSKIKNYIPKYYINFNNIVGCKQFLFTNM